MTYKVKHTTKSRLVQTTLMLVLLGIAVYVFMQSSFFECKQVVVEGNKLLDERTILKAADVPMGSNLFYIDDSLVKTRLGLLPLVDEAMIYKELPGTFRIKLVERVPTIILSFFEKFILLDAKGYYIQDVETINEYNLPVVTGIDAKEGLALGSKLESRLLDSVLLVFYEIWDAYGEYFVELNLFGGENDIILYTGEGVGVKIGAAVDLREKMEVFEKLYQEKICDQDFNDLEYIDVSSLGFPVLKYK
jgi:cell division septal protein FtsQ